MKSGPGQSNCSGCGQFLGTLSPDQITTDETGEFGRGKGAQYCPYCTRKFQNQGRNQQEYMPYGDPMGAMNPPQAQPAETNAFNLKRHKTATVTETDLRFDPLGLAVEFLHDFQDEDELMDFVESLDDSELSIMMQHKDDPNVLRKLRITIADDVDSTAKELAMEG